MTNFPRIRTAVNLWLIVVMMIQPVACVWAATGCGGGNRGVSSGLIVALDSDAACGCCQADDSAAGGCCCRQRETPRSDPEPSQQLADDSLHLGCCASSRSERRRSDHGASQGSHPAPPTVANVAESREAVESRKAVESLDAEHGFRPACFCDRNTTPLSDPATQRGSSELRSDILVAAADLQWVSPRHPTPKSSPHVVQGLLPAHFSQVHLCIWRL